jgi:HEAT repeat protein
VVAIANRTHWFVALGLSGMLFCLLPSGSVGAEKVQPGQDAALDRLIEQLGDEEFERRQQAEKQLAKMQTRSAVVALARAAAGHRDLEVRHRAGKILVRVRAAWVDVLIGQLASPSPDRRAEARRELAAVGRPALQGLRRAAAGHSNPQVRLGARVLLLIEGLGHDEFMRREAAQKELVAIGVPALEALRQAGADSPDVEIRNRAIKALDAISTGPQRARKVVRLASRARVARLIDQLGDDTFDRREAVQKELVEIGAPALKALRQATTHPDMEVRRRSAAAIKSISARQK